MREMPAPGHARDLAVLLLYISTRVCWCRRIFTYNTYTYILYIIYYYIYIYIYVTTIELFALVSAARA